MVSEPKLKVIPGGNGVDATKPYERITQVDSAQTSISSDRSTETLKGMGSSLGPVLNYLRIIDTSDTSETISTGKGEQEKVDEMDGSYEKYLDQRFKNIENKIDHSNETIALKTKQIEDTIKLALESNSKLIKMVQDEVHSQNDRMNVIGESTRSMKQWLVGTGIAIIVVMLGALYFINQSNQNFIATLQSANQQHLSVIIDLLKP